MDKRYNNKRYQNNKTNYNNNILLDNTNRDQFRYKSLNQDPDYEITSPQEIHIKKMSEGARMVTTINSRIVRPLEILAMNIPTKGEKAIHQAQ